MQVFRFRARKIFACILALILVVASLPLTVSAATDTSTAGQTRVKLTLKEPPLKYDPNINWATHMMYADGKMAYCVNPALPAPKGTFTTTDNNCVKLTSENTKNYNSLVKALYYCYGGDGFNTKLETAGNKTMKGYMDSLRKSEWGVVLLNPQGENLYYLLTHRVLAKIYGDSDWAYALPSAWQDAVTKIESVIKKAPMIKSITELYILDTGNSTTQKVILSKNKIKLQLKKASEDTSITEGNNCYSLKGAVYDIYLDKACKVYFGSITTDKILTSGEDAGKGYGQYGGGNYGSDVPWQPYYAKEVNAPQGYALDDTVYEFKDSGKTTAEGKHIYTVDCVDVPQNDPIGILLQKTDKKGKGLEGAEFTVCYYNDFYNDESELKGVSPTRSWVFRTNALGMVRMSKEFLVSDGDFYYIDGNHDPTFPLGTVTIQETKAPDGYIIDDKLFITQVTGNSSGDNFVYTYNAPVIPNEEASGKLKIVKTSDDGVVSGVEFVVKNNETGEEKTYTTGSDGTITEDLVVGTYTVTEKTDTTKYYPQEPQTVTVKADKTATVKFHNKLTTDGLTIKKYSPDGNIENIKFYIKNNSTGAVLEKSTDKNGYITIDNLTIGSKYTITEEVPEGYEPQSPKTITIAQGGNFVTFTNTPQYGNLLIKKTCDNGKLKGFAFTVQKVDENGKALEWLTPQWGVQTNENGEIRFENIPVGNYRVAEVGDWESFYENPESEKTVRVQKDETGKYTTVEFENKEITRKVKIVKNSADGNVSGITFEVTGYFGDNPQKITKEFITDKNGIISEDFPASDYGEEYTVREVVPEGYEEQEEQSFYLDLDTPDEVTELKFNNVRKPEIKVVKTSDDKKVEGIPFVISCINDDGTVSSERKVTDKDGVIIFTKIADEYLINGREYTVTEEVLDGYAPQEPKKVTAVSGEVAEVKFHNSVVTDLKIIKTSEDEIVKNIYFSVRANGSLIGNYATDENGLITLTDLLAYRNGRLLTYTVTELGVANGDGTYTIPNKYIKPNAQNKSLQVSADSDNLITFEFYNNLKKGSVEVVKSVENPELPLDGWKFTISGNGIEPITKTTDTDGKILFENLPIGTYTVTEMDYSADGIKILPSQTVTVGYNKTTTVNLCNGYIPNDIRFIKTSEDGKGLSGVHFEIYEDEECNSVATDVYGKTLNEAVSDESGLVEFKGLRYGTYYIAETQTVNGKQLLTGVITAIVSKDGCQLTYAGKSLEKATITDDNGEKTEVQVIKNVDIPKLPFTGGSGVWLSTILGILLIVISSGSLFVLKKKKIM